MAPPKIDPTSGLLFFLSGRAMSNERNTVKKQCGFRDRLRSAGGERKSGAQAE